MHGLVTEWPVVAVQHVNYESVVRNSMDSRFVSSAQSGPLGQWVHAIRHGMSRVASTEKIQTGLSRSELIGMALEPLGQLRCFLAPYKITTRSARTWAVWLRLSRKLR